MVIISKLQQYREGLGLSKNKLSKLSGVSDVMIGYLETGKRIGTENIWNKLAEALNVPVNSIRISSTHPIDLLITQIQEYGFTCEDGTLNSLGEKLLINEVNKLLLLKK